MFSHSIAVCAVTIVYPRNYAFVVISGYVRSRISRYKTSLRRRMCSLTRLCASCCNLQTSLCRMKQEFVESERHQNTKPLCVNRFVLSGITKDLRRQTLTSVNICRLINNLFIWSSNEVIYSIRWIVRVHSTPNSINLSFIYSQILIWN